MGKESEAKQKKDTEAAKGKAISDGTGKVKTPVKKDVKPFPSE